MVDKPCNDKKSHSRDFNSRRFKIFLFRYCLWNTIYTVIFKWLYYKKIDKLREILKIGTHDLATYLSRWFPPIFENNFCNTGQQIIFVNLVIQKLLQCTYTVTILKAEFPAYLVKSLWYCWWTVMVKRPNKVSLPVLLYWKNHVGTTIFDH